MTRRAAASVPDGQELPEVSPVAHPRPRWLGALLSLGLLGAAVRPSPQSPGPAPQLGQRCRCLHPPAGGIAFLGVFLKAGAGFVLFPVLSGSVLLMLLAWLFSRWVKGASAYPVHWL